MNFVNKIKILQNYFKTKNFKKVIKGCEILNKKFPNNSFVLNLAGMAYQEIEKNHQSIVFFESALKADSTNIAAMNNLGNAFKYAGQYEKADRIFQKIITINPNYIQAYNNYANLKFIVNDIEGAIKLYKQALIIAKEKKIDPIHLLIHLSSSYRSLNRKKEAIETINEILRIEPDNINAHKSLSSIYKYSRNDEETMTHISKMKNIFNTKDLDDSEKGIISFALGKAFDDLKDVEPAINFLSIGNKYYHKIYKTNIDEEVNTINNIKKIFKDIDMNISHKNFSNKQIIFICGMPRSGTTLIEQIISSHKKVYGAGELEFLTNLTLDNFFTDDKLNKQKIIEQQNSLKNLINDQYNEKFSLYEFTEKIITDKNPFNFKWIGFIKIFFPNSKIIHCKRNPKDNCLSIYKNSFTSPLMNWAYSQKNISRYYNNYNLLMKFWNTLVPDFIYTAEYEKIVSDKENEINRLLKFCALEHDENCFNPHKNIKTPIKTASISQARESVYNSSINSNDKYSEHLKEMFENLD
jgi:tetratricopeptide (TPR) repeat protein